VRKSINGGDNLSRGLSKLPQPLYLISWDPGISPGTE
jgi:hypothetical protein